MDASSSFQGATLLVCKFVLQEARQLALGREEPAIAIAAREAIPKARRANGKQTNAALP